MVHFNNPLPSRLLIGRDRLFYSGLLGRGMKARRFGATMIYISPDSHLELRFEGEPWQKRRLVAVPAYVPHQLRTPSGYIANITIEAETIDEITATNLVTEINQGSGNTRLIELMMAARHEVTSMRDVDGFSTADFDRFFLGRELKQRTIDPRIRHVLDRLVDEQSEIPISADDCARDIDLSTSRFLHLFKENTHNSFRTQRMWKRARRFMDHANRNDTLTDIALSLGYPDSSYFSHSIRASFGLTPRSIRDGSRDMQVNTGENYILSSI